MFYIIPIVLFLPFMMHLVLTRFCGLFTPLEISSIDLQKRRWRFLFLTGFRQEFSRQKGVLLGFAAGFPVLAIIFFGTRVCNDGVYLFLIYVLSGYIYFHLFNLSETGRRIRILTAIYKGSSDKDEIIRRYSCSDMVSNRLKRLVNLKQLRVSDGRYFIKGKLLLFAGRILFRFRRILFPGQTVIVPMLSGRPAKGETAASLLKMVVATFRLRFIALRRFGFLNYPAVCLIYILTNLQFLLSPDLPVWDTWSYHFPAFKYIAETIAKGHFPQWFPVSGGIRIGLFHINLFPFLPHRIIGYLLYSLLPISAVLAYKLQFILGVLIMGFGWWLVLKKITKCPYSSFLGALMVVMGGTGMTFHQEQVLATVYLIPWFVLSLLKIRENSLSILPAIMLFGMGLSTHYPHIQLISMGLFGFWGLRRSVAADFSLRKKTQTKVCGYLPVATVLLFLLTLLPCFYLAVNLKTVVSPLRGGQDGDIKLQNYEDYLKLNYKQISSAKAEYFQQYVKPVIKWDDLNIAQAVDRCSFFVGRLGIVLAVIGVFFGWKRSFSVVILLIIFSALTLGINCPVSIPKYLFLLHFPFIGIFRQWFHFFPMVNFCLSILAAMGLSRITGYFRQRKAAFIFGVLVTFILSVQILDLAVYSQKYTSVFVFHKKMPPEISDYIFHPDNFADSYFLPSSLLQYKSRAELYSLAPQAIPVQPFYAGAGLCARPDKYKLENDGFSLDITTAQQGMLVTPLNYDLGLSAFVNGKQVKVEKIHNALAGVLLEKGEQQIRFKLIPDAYLLIALSQLFIYMFCIIPPTRRAKPTA